MRRPRSGDEPVDPGLVLRRYERAHTELVVDRGDHPRVAARRRERCLLQRLQGLPVVGIFALVLDLTRLQLGAGPMSGASALPGRVRLGVDELHVTDPDE